VECRGDDERSSFIFQFVWKPPSQPSRELR